jgi:phosphatidylinositol alpha-1,6-mannosyltransferase
MKKTSMQKAKVVLLTLDYPPERGGVAAYLGNLVSHSNGWIRVIVEKTHDRSGPGAVVEKELVRTAWPKWWPMVGVIRSLDREMESVLVSHIFPVGTAAWISRLWGGPSYVILVHGLDIRLARTFWKKWLLRRICHSAKSVVANSETTKVDLLKLVSGLRVRVITPGVERREVLSRGEARMKLSIDPADRLVVSLARLVTRKGIDVALEAIGRVQRKQSTRYVVIGDGPDLNRLEKVAEESRTEVTWLRAASDDEKWMWLAAADVFLLPVRDEGNSVEGFGIVFLEAALAGIPAIAGKSGGAGEAVRHERTGLLVRPTSVDEVAAAVLRLLNDPAEREKLGGEAQHRVLKDFRWEDIASAFLAEFD